VLWLLLLQNIDNKGAFFSSYLEQMMHVYSHFVMRASMMVFATIVPAQNFSDIAKVSFLWWRRPFFCVPLFLFLQLLNYFVNIFLGDT